MSRWTKVYVGLLLGFVASPAMAEDDPAGLEFFEKNIRPALVKHCYECHSAKSKVKGGLVLDTREGIRRGGESGHAVVPGDVEGSEIIGALRHETVDMPPDDMLPEELIKQFEHWISIGAPDPRDGPAPIRRDIDFAEGRQHWAFQLPQHHAPPEVRDAGWPRTEIDQFVLAKLEAAGLKPAADASRRALARRLYYDLIGMPPSPAEMTTFLSDKSPTAVETLVDRLLESPHYGERWGRHWLDVARYAESNGRERNFLYPNAWRYRDYVIRSFNADKPFDQFIREQIAGDLLEDVAGGPNEGVIATGFLAIGPKSLNERNREKFVMDIVDEQIDVVTRGFMAFTVSCARCHDHKFDPVPSSDYYALAGIFRSTETRYGTGGGGGNRQASKLIALQGENDEAQQAQVKHEQRLKKLRDQVKSLQAEIRAGNSKGKNNKRKKKPAAEENAQADKADKAAQPANKRATAQKVAQARRRLKQLNNQIKTLTNDGPSSGNVAMGVQEGKVADSPIYIRGEVESPNGSAPRGYITVLCEDEPRRATGDTSGRRQLAEWITDSQNPLTARVYVNRVWSHLFLNGIVRTVDNFGATGERPSHPELLDNLALQFVAEGWSTKKLLKRIAMSRTYQQANTYVEAAYAKDPENQLFWRASPRRLDAEALRDALLKVSGQLDPQPREKSVIANQKGTVAIGRGLRLEDLREANRHRSVYLPIVRNAVPDTLKIFDFAEPSMLVGHRQVTNVPAQALFMMNSRFVLRQAEETAKRIVSDSALDEDGRVLRAFELVLCRPPSETEAAKSADFLQDVVEQQADGDSSSAQKAAYSALVQALFASAEFRYVD
ncbi:MAG: PSD1 and planctomycete cytochrome C domain-containing protein [Pirellulaceae bacterium]|nr:PSD1 and planctomycete cytochrome C domain-containing protein [Pirellulaceae bacterium]MDP7015698.1 PSD1 and planctomycete cytochrome C domain-containing protein [Pirellulaceae bacterium]